MRPMSSTLRPARIEKRPGRRWQGSEGIAVGDPFWLRIFAKPSPRPQLMGIGVSCDKSLDGFIFTLLCTSAVPLLLHFLSRPCTFSPRRHDVSATLLS